MAIAATAPQPLAPRGRALGDKGFRILAMLSGLAVVLILALIAFSTTKEAWPAFRAEGLGFVTSDRWEPSQGHFGALAFIFGTLASALVALVISVPVSIGIALFMTEFAPARLRKPAVYAIDLLAAIPSVVYGLWGIYVLAPTIAPFYGSISNAVRGIPVLDTFFGGQANGKSIFTCGIILALMVTPIVTALTREVFETVPRAQKEAALALGATRWEMIRAAVFPHSANGMLGAIILGLGRALGETIAAALVIGSSAQITSHLFASGDTMAGVIANQFGEASGTHRAALIGLGVVLFGITILVNLAARSIVGRQVAKSQGR